ncbi:MAG: META domain-containing protein [Flavobacteriales bacterium]|nr:META domain-containing protein [Flavobacteriales bacterium]
MRTFHPLFRRLVLATSAPLLACGVSASVVFLGVPLSSRLLGQWRVVQVFGNDLTRSFPPFTVRFEKDGRLVGRSGCGTFTGNWTTGPDRVHFRGMVPSGGNCGELSVVERKVIEAMAVARETRVEKNGVVLMHEGKPVALLVPQQT